MKKRMKKANSMRKAKGLKDLLKRFTTEQIVVGALIGLSVALVIISFGVIMATR
ncbi:MAG: hypothetical protein HY538_05900 [Deltaproteobacteria bacterium]|nr:hypothetical protein [Deltaproteobacteria bacterium]